MYGPWLLYINRGNASVSSYDDAVRQSRREQRQWPYAFVSDAAYHSRGEVTGTVSVVDKPDPRGPPPSVRGATVFLTSPTAIHGPYTTHSEEYTYWNYTDAEGRFSFSGVRSGNYELHVSVPGVIGELSGTLLTVTAGSTTPVGTVHFEVPRNGSTVWEIGYADRTAKEYRHGDAYRYWGLYDLFPSEFPSSVHYFVNSSWRQPPEQWRSQWNYAHVPANGSQTVWSVYFDVPGVVTGPEHSAFLRIAFAGVVHCQLALTLNGNTKATIEDLNDNDTSIYRDGIHGIYETRTVQLDSSNLKTTGNVLQLTCLCTARFDGLMYDALKFELQGWTPPRPAAIQLTVFSE